MARVNLEERAFAETSRINRVAREMAGKWMPDERMVLGCLGWFWHDSQEAMRTSGTAEEIADWCRAKNPEEAKALVAALLAGKYISDNGDGTFEIHGNEDQIEMMVEHKKKSRKGGAATRKKWLAIKAQKNQKHNRGPQAMPGEASAHAKPGPQVGSMQGNARQGNAVQFKAEQGIEEENPPTPLQGELGPEIPFDDEPPATPAKKRKRSKRESTPEDLELGKRTQEVIRAYCEAFKKRWKTNPDMSVGKEQGAAKALAREGWTYEKATKFFAAYMQLADGFVVANKHALALFSSKIQAIKVRLETGVEDHVQQSAAQKRSSNWQRQWDQAEAEEQAMMRSEGGFSDGFQEL